MALADLPYMSLPVPRELVESDLPWELKTTYIALLNECQRQRELLRSDRVGPLPDPLRLPDNGHGLTGFTLHGRSTQLARALGIHRQTLYRHLRGLQAAGWVEMDRPGPHHSPTPARTPTCHLRHPWLESRLAELVNVKRRLGRAQYAGQGIMGEYCTLMIASKDFTDNARPGFLVNPLTGQPLEFDRWYTAGVGFEFNGPQHYGATPTFPDPAQAQQTQERDILKAILSQQHGVHIVTVAAQDLTLDGMRAKIEPLGNVLPLRPLYRDDPVLQYVADAGERYARRARREFPETGNERQTSSIDQ